jgi:hypothetical protein
VVYEINDILPLYPTKYMFVIKKWQGNFVGIAIGHSRKVLDFLQHIIFPPWEQNGTA